MSKDSSNENNIVPKNLKNLHASFCKVNMPHKKATGLLAVVMLGEIHDLSQKTDLLVCDVLKIYNPIHRLRQSYHSQNCCSPLFYWNQVILCLYFTLYFFITFYVCLCKCVIFFFLVCLLLQQYLLFKSLLGYTLNCDENDVTDFTVKYFNSDNGACNNCDEKDDAFSEKKRFFHIIKYCEDYGWDHGILYELNMN